MNAVGEDDVMTEPTAASTSVRNPSCRHLKRPHTVWYWLEDGDPIPVPLSATFDNRADAMRFAQSGIDQDNPILRWVKVFRADNEAYTCFQWDNPRPLPKPEPAPTPVAEHRRRWWQRRAS